MTRKRRVVNALIPFALLALNGAFAGQLGRWLFIGAVLLSFPLIVYFCAWTLVRLVREYVAFRRKTE